MANKQNSIGLTARFGNSLALTALAIIFWAIVNIFDIIEPSPALDTVKVIAYLAIAFSGVTILIDWFISKKKK